MLVIADSHEANTHTKRSGPLTWPFCYALTPALPPPLSLWGERRRSIFVVYNHPMSLLRAFFLSFQYAVSGCIHAMQSERNTKLFVILSLIVICIGFLFPLTAMDWVAILLAIGGFLAIELMNTALERLADCVDAFHGHHKKEIHDNYIRRCKDVAAGAALIMGTVTIVVVLIVFLPHL